MTVCGRAWLVQYKCPDPLLYPGDSLGLLKQIPTKLPTLLLWEWRELTASPNYGAAKPLGLHQRHAPAPLRVHGDMDSSDKLSPQILQKSPCGAGSNAPPWRALSAAQDSSQPAFR